MYSLHLESCTSMYGPSNTLCTSEKAYWQMADALIFFLKTDPPGPRRKDSHRDHHLSHHQHTDHISNTAELPQWTQRSPAALYWLKA